MKNKNWMLPLFIMGVLLLLTNCTKDEETKKEPVITWAAPADITYGTLLSATQLNAIADVPGTFVYTPALGTKLEIGANKELKVVFTPTDAVKYNTATKTVKINVVAVTDADGNVYQTVTIGTQTWMVENLRSTKYNDGTAIPNVTSASEWSNLTTGAYCNLNNTTRTDTITTFGRLYNWYAVNTGKLAPQGWHVPTDAEWTTLTTYLGGESVAGGKLKETGTTHWATPNTGATNETNFKALPGGSRGRSFSVGKYGAWWSATVNQLDEARNPFFREMGYDYVGVQRSFSNKDIGYSVRCIKD